MRIRCPFMMGVAQAAHCQLGFVSVVCSIRGQAGFEIDCIARSLVRSPAGTDSVRLRTFCRGDHTASHPPL